MHIQLKDDVLLRVDVDTAEPGYRKGYCETCRGFWEDEHVRIAFSFENSRDLVFDVMIQNTEDVNITFAIDWLMSNYKKMRFFFSVEEFFYRFTYSSCKFLKPSKTLDWRSDLFLVIEDNFSSSHEFEYTDDRQIVFWLDSNYDDLGRLRLFIDSFDFIRSH